VIKAVFLDAIKTIFAPYPSEAGLYKKVIRDITGKDMDEADIVALLAQAMAETEALDAVKENSIQQWEYFPTRLARLIGCAESECKSVGDKLRYETWGNPNNYRLYEDILPTLKKLEEKGLYVACVSNEDGWLESFFDHFHIKKYFGFVLASAEIGVEKPNPKIFHEAMSRTSFRPEEILFVGDSVISDYEGSKAAHMKPLLIDRAGMNTDNNVIAIQNLTEIMEHI
jgi:putative hydrolase of the HAD superfamily